MGFLFGCSVNIYVHEDFVIAAKSPQEALDLLFNENGGKGSLYKMDEEGQLLIQTDPESDIATYAEDDDRFTVFENPNDTVSVLAKVSDFCNVVSISHVLADKRSY